MTGCAKKDVAVEEDGDHDDYWQHRFHQARRAGLTRVEANRFAGGEATLRMLRQCVDGKVPPRTTARIVC